MDSILQIGIIVVLITAAIITALYFIHKKFPIYIDKSLLRLKKLGKFPDLDTKIFSEPVELMVHLNKRFSELLYRCDKFVIENDSIIAKPILFLGLVFRKIHELSLQTYIVFGVFAIVIFYFIFRNL